jgi:hypothetical protein
MKAQQYKYVAMIDVFGPAIFGSPKIDTVSFVSWLTILKRLAE